MLLPDQMPSASSPSAQNDELLAWAKSESKSASTEYDLLQTNQNRERVSWRSALSFAIHVVHLILSTTIEP